MNTPLIQILCAFAALLTITLSAGEAPAPGEPNPADPNLRLWLNSSATHTLWQDAAGTIPATNGLPVARWDDLSASGIVVTQTDLNFQPVFSNSVAGLNGAPAVMFNQDGLISTNGNSTGISTNDRMTVITVWQNTGFNGLNYQHNFHMGVQDTSRAYGHSTAKSANENSRIGNHYWNGGYDSFAQSSTNATMALSFYDGAIDTWYVNGFPAGNRGIDLNVGTNELVVGNRLTPLVEGFVGHLAELIIYDRVLSAGERSALGTYMGDKYGIPIQDKQPRDPNTPLVDLSTGEPLADHLDLRLWLDASDANTLWGDIAGTIPVTNGQDVARWDDKSLLQLVVQQTDTNHQPVFASAVSNLGDRPAVHFTGGIDGDALSAVGGNQTGIFDSPFLTLVTIWQNTGFTGQNYQHTFHMGTPTTAQAYGHSVSRAANAGSGIGNHYWGAGFDTTNQTAALDVPTMAFSSYDGTNDTWFINGAPAGVRSVALNIGVDQLQIGSRLNPFVEGFTGDLSEVLLFGRVMTLEERNALGFYIQEKYGITIQDASTITGFGIRSIAYLPGLNPVDAQVIITWDSRDGATYLLELAEFPEGPWSPLASGIPGDPDETIYTHNVMEANLLRRRYFRVGEE